MMRILHYANSFDLVSLTFVRSFVTKSNEFATTLRVANSSSNDEILVLPPIYYDRRKPKEFFYYLIDKLSKTSKRDKRWKEIIKSFSPDIIHCHFGQQGIICGKYIRSSNSKTPFVTSFYGYDAFSLPKRNKKYLSDLKKLFELDNAFFFAEGPNLKAQLVSLGANAKKVLINPLLVEMGTFRSLKTNVTKVRFLMIGRFVEKKGFHLALEALGQLKHKLPEFIVDIIGYGELEGKLRNTVNKYGLEDYVSFLGKQPNEMVKNVLHEYDFFLHPSHTASDGDSEGGAPTILVEAQASGLKIISSNHADIPYIMGYHDFLAEEGDLVSLKETIVKAIEFPDWTHLTQKGRHHVEKQHSIVTSTIYGNNLKQIMHNFA